MKGCSIGREPTIWARMLIPVEWWAVVSVTRTIPP
jgi:hypothetical protein